MSSESSFYPSDATSPAEAAAQWSARLHSGRFTPADEQALDDWLQADPENEREFMALEQLSSLASTLDKDLVSSLYGGAVPVRPDLRRRKLIRNAGALVAVAGSAGLASLVLSPQAVYAASLQTRVGERRWVPLPDGSSLELNTGTQAELRFYEDSRHLHLIQGEVMFSVASSPQRPFTVKAGTTQVRVTGTSFTVRHDAEQVKVLVESGSVEVSSGRWWNRQTRYLAAGSGATISPEEGLSIQTDVDVAAATAWRQGRLIVRDVSLSEVVAEINRYREQPIRIAEAKLGQQRVTASFLLDEQSAVLQALQQILPLRARTQDDGSIILVSAS
ncbi:FecR family protein [Alcaligenes parafaecalis]|uniref:FecR family protein n=1 Tax=Alcaligenes parafaecalis TaxID=171260 RepID=A0ABT3VSM5_9BURK|nr:FecR family protein [Alcaligenes parafaecalis]MCX5465220.1 FecR family protein [Alcaligenes parafaecalis]